MKADPVDVFCGGIHCGSAMSGRSGQKAHHAIGRINKRVPKVVGITEHVKMLWPLSTISGELALNDMALT